MEIYPQPAKLQGAKEINLCLSDDVGIRKLIVPGYKEHLFKVWWKSIHRQLNHKTQGKISIWWPWNKRYDLWSKSWHSSSQVIKNIYAKLDRHLNYKVEGKSWRPDMLNEVIHICSYASQGNTARLFSGCRFKLNSMMQRSIKSEQGPL